MLICCVGRLMQKFDVKVFGFDVIELNSFGWLDVKVMCITLELMYMDFITNTKTLG